MPFKSFSLLLPAVTSPSVITMCKVVMALPASWSAAACCSMISRSSLNDASKLVEFSRRMSCTAEMIRRTVSSLTLELLMTTLAPVLNVVSVNQKCNPGFSFEADARNSTIFAVVSFANPRRFSSRIELETSSAMWTR